MQQPATPQQELELQPTRSSRDIRSPASTGSLHSVTSSVESSSGAAASSTGVPAEATAGAVSVTAPAVSSAPVLQVQPSVTCHVNVQSTKLSHDPPDLMQFEKGADGVMISNDMLEKGETLETCETLIDPNQPQPGEHGELLDESFDSPPSKSKCKGCKKKTQRYINMFWRHPLTTFFMTSLILCTMFLDDIRVIAGNKDQDDAFAGAALAWFIIFSLEFLTLTFARKRGAFYFFVDFIATFSLLSEIPWIWDHIYPNRGFEDLVSRGSTQPIGSQVSDVVGRVGRLVRLLRLSRVAHAFLHVDPFAFVRPWLRRDQDLDRVKDSKSGDSAQEDEDEDEYDEDEDEDDEDRHASGDDENYERAVHNPETAQATQSRLSLIRQSLIRSGSSGFLFGEQTMKGPADGQTAQDNASSSGSLFTSGVPPQLSPTSSAQVPTSRLTANVHRFSAVPEENDSEEESKTPHDSTPSADDEDDNIKASTTVAQGASRRRPSSAGSNSASISSAVATGAAPMILPVHSSATPASNPPSGGPRRNSDTAHMLLSAEERRLLESATLNVSTTTTPDHSPPASPSAVDSIEPPEHYDAQTIPRTLLPLAPLSPPRLAVDPTAPSVSYTSKHSQPPRPAALQRATSRAQLMQQVRAFSRTTSGTSSSAPGSGRRTSVDRVVSSQSWIAAFLGNFVKAVKLGAGVNVDDTAFRVRKRKRRQQQGAQKQKDRAEQGVRATRQQVVADPEELKDPVRREARRAELLNRIIEHERKARRKAKRIEEEETETMRKGARNSSIGVVISDNTTRVLIGSVLILVLIVRALTYRVRDQGDLADLDYLQWLADQGNPTTLALATQAYIAHKGSELLYLALKGDFDSPIVNNAARIAELRESEILRVRIFVGDSVVAMSYIDHRDRRVEDAWFSIGVTLLVLFMLLVGSRFFNQDTFSLVIVPIVRMVNFVNNIVKDPYQPVPNLEERDDNADTFILQQTMTKLAHITRTGFGAASKYWVSKVVVDLNKRQHQVVPVGSRPENTLPSRQILGVFGFADIRGFDVLTGVLDVQIMEYVNLIARVLHDRVHKLQGNANKNTGNAFLIVWNLPPNEERKRQEEADEAVFFNYDTPAEDEYPDDEMEKFRQYMLEKLIYHEEFRHDYRIPANARDRVISSTRSNRSVGSMSRNVVTSPPKLQPLRLQYLDDDTKSTVSGASSAGERTSTLSGTTTASNGYETKLPAFEAHGGNTMQVVLSGTPASTTMSATPHDTSAFSSPVPRHIRENVQRAVAARAKELLRLQRDLYNISSPVHVQLAVTRALVAFLLARHELDVNTKIRDEWSERILKDTGLVASDMGFGLHLGWAVEGAIGTVYKMDISYLSPHVNMAARLDVATRQFGVYLLMSGVFRAFLPKRLRDRCRRIDCVKVKGSAQPLELYTFDVTMPMPILAKDIKELDTDVGTRSMTFMFARKRHAQSSMRLLDRSGEKDDTTASLRSTASKIEQGNEADPEHMARLAADLGLSAAGSSTSNTSTFAVESNGSTMGLLQPRPLVGHTSPGPVSASITPNLQSSSPPIDHDAMSTSDLADPNHLGSMDLTTLTSITTTSTTTTATTTTNNTGSRGSSGSSSPSASHSHRSTSTVNLTSIQVSPNPSPGSQNSSGSGNGSGSGSSTENSLSNAVSPRAGAVVFHGLPAPSDQPVPGTNVVPVTHSSTSQVGAPSPPLPESLPALQSTATSIVSAQQPGSIVPTAQCSSSSGSSSGRAGSSAPFSPPMLSNYRVVAERIRREAEEQRIKPDELESARRDINTLCAFAEKLQSNIPMQWVELHSQAVAKYLEGDWIGAWHHFRQVEAYLRNTKRFQPFYVPNGAYGRSPNVHFTRSIKQMHTYSYLPGAISIQTVLNAMVQMTNQYRTEQREAHEKLLKQNSLSSFSPSAATVSTVSDAATASASATAIPEDLELLPELDDVEKLQSYLANPPFPIEKLHVPDDWEGARQLTKK